MRLQKTHTKALFRNFFKKNKNKKIMRNFHHIPLGFFISKKKFPTQNTTDRNNLL
jgi:hypothetical protein